MKGERYFTGSKDRSPFEILSKIKIGEGGYGTVYKIETLAGGERGKYAIKEYTGIAPRTKTRDAVNAHIALERAGAKTLPVYQLLEGEETKILMTLHDSDEVYVVDGKPVYKAMEPVEPPAEEKIDRIEKFENFINQFYLQSVLAAKVGIEFKMDDVFRFTVDKKDKSRVDFWVEDFDLVNLPTRTLDDSTKVEIMERNLRVSKDVMTFFLSTRVKDEMKQRYLAESETAYNALSDADKIKLLAGEFK